MHKISAQSLLVEDPYTRSKIPVQDLCTRYLQKILVQHHCTGYLCARFLEKATVKGPGKKSAFRISALARSDKRSLYKILVQDLFQGCLCKVFLPRYLSLCISVQGHSVEDPLNRPPKNFLGTGKELPLIKSSMQDPCKTSAHHGGRRPYQTPRRATAIPHQIRRGLPWLHKSSCNLYEVLKNLATAKVKITTCHNAAQNSRVDTKI